MRLTRPWSRADTLLTAALCVSAFLVAEWYLPVYRAGGGIPRFYQDQFAPAVMLACGRGFVNIDAPGAPPVDDFLQQRTASLGCDEVPASVTIKPVTPLQGSARYLMTAAGLVWRVTGVNFHALDGLIAAGFAIAIAAAYVGVRLACGRTSAVVVVLLWMSSYRHLENLPHLRDYSKAPFFMVLLAAMAFVMADRSARSLIAVGAVFGAMQGLGFGMRTDVAQNFVPFFIALFATALFGRMRSLRWRLACAAVSLGLFVVVSLPILRSYASQSSLWHIVLLGFTAPYDENLNIGFPRPAYSFPYAHNDSYIETVVRAYWKRTHPSEPLLMVLTRPYDRACQDYFFRLAANFPGDLVTRAVASIARIVNLPFSLPDGVVPVGVVNPVLKNLWQFRGQLAQSVNGSGLILALAALTVVGVQTPWLAAIAFLLLLFWGAFPALEFQGRHIFQLELVVLALFAWTIAAILGAVRKSGMPSPGDSGFTTRRVLRSAMTVATLVVAVGSTVAVARAYQIPNARKFVTAYDEAPSTNLETTVIPLNDGTVRLAVDLFRPSEARADVDEVLLKAEFDFAACGHPAAVNPVFSYDVADPFLAAFSRATPLEDLGAPPTRVFLPVYSVVRDWNVVAQFAGVDVPAAFARCVRLSRVDDPGSLPLVLPVTIAPDWPRKLYQRVRLDSGLGY
jgi:hypothetical protein